MTELTVFEKQDPKGFLDRAIARLTSRKLLVWGFSTGLLLSGTLTGEQWIYVSLAYLGSQGIADIVATVKKAK